MSEYIKSKFQKAVFSSLEGIPVEEDEDYGPPLKKVNFQFTTEERVAFYQDILGRLRSDNDPQEIATAIVVSVNEHLKEKQDEAYGRTGVKGSIFRRIQ